MRRFSNTLNDSIPSLQSKLSLYSETISALQKENSKLSKENEYLKQQISGYAKPASLPNKSGLMEIIESFQAKSCEVSSLNSLKQEFDDIELLQSSLKSENSGLKLKIQKFIDLGPVTQKIGSLTQKLYFFAESVMNKEDLNISNLLTSDTVKKNSAKPEFFLESLNKTKELLEKIINSIIDRAAENNLNESCQIF